MTVSALHRCATTWLGAVLAISFMEAWVKFQAPSIQVDKTIGLEVGREVFAAFHSVQAVVLMVFLFCCWRARLWQWRLGFAAAITVTITTVLEITVLGPLLDQRAAAAIDSGTIENSGIHWYYMVCEGLKTIGLIFLGFKNSPLHLEKS